MPQETATVMSLPQAHAVIKEMKLNSLEWSSDYRRHGRRALKVFSEDRMRHDIDHYLLDKTRKKDQNEMRCHLHRIMNAQK